MNDTIICPLTNLLILDISRIARGRAMDATHNRPISARFQGCGRDSLYPTFRPAAQAANRIGPPAVPRLFCGNAPFVSRIRSSATGTAASRHTTSITIGLISAAAGVPVVGRPLRCCRGFHCLIPTTAYWLVARHCGGALNSTTPGNRPRRRSKTQTACPILRRSAVGRAVWTAPNRRFRFCAKRSPASITG